MNTSSAALSLQICDSFPFARKGRRGCLVNHNYKYFQGCIQCSAESKSEMPPDAKEQALLRQVILVDMDCAANR
jgi:hypothetical protein